MNRISSINGNVGIDVLQLTMYTALDAIKYYNKFVLIEYACILRKTKHEQAITVGNSIFEYLNPLSEPIIDSIVLESFLSNNFGWLKNQVYQWLMITKLMIQCNEDFTVTSNALDFAINATGYYSKNSLNQYALLLQQKQLPFLCSLGNQLDKFLTKIPSNIINCDQIYVYLSKTCNLSFDKKKQWILLTQYLSYV